MTDHIVDPVPEPVRQLVAVFKEKLSSITFPDVSLEIIETLAEKLRAAEKAVGQAQKQLETARQELDASSEELQQKCVKALAYAKVFAEGQDDLAERLAAINLGKPARTQKRPATDKPKQGEGPAGAPAGAPSPRHKKPVAAEAEAEKQK